MRLIRWFELGPAALSPDLVKLPVLIDETQGSEKQG
jgi:hypothetical protein